ncbi:MAG: glycoside hydrolase family 31 protein [bacterium]
MRLAVCNILFLFLFACDDGGSAAGDSGGPDAFIEPPFDGGRPDGARPPVDGGRPDGMRPPAPDMDPPPEGCAFATAADTPPEPPRHTPRWAFLPWISKDISDRDDTFAFVQGFQDRDIPVGVLVLDSPWETHYNTFVPNPSRYPAFGEMVATLRADGVRTVLWVTQMVNQASIDLEAGGDVYMGPSPNYEEGRDCGFYVDEGTLYRWWKGIGAGVDFFNPHARGWWHRQQDALLDLGVAGWKLDFGEQYIKNEPLATAAGPVAHQAYSEAYYRDYLAYCVARLGPEECVTMVRPWDESYEHAGRFFARPEHAPVGWVGDNRRDRVGLVDALDHLFRSAKAGYVVIGSDIGGYLDRDDRALAEEVPYDRPTFFDWVAVGAMTPFMQLHGRANLTPWSLPDGGEAESVAHYRAWAWLHTALVPFWYSLAEAAYAGAPPIMRPIGDGPEAWAGDWRYLLGEAFLVAPPLDGSGARDVALPAGERWYDWWRPGQPALDGGQVLSGYAPGPGRIPLFVREGAIVPADVENDANGLGDAGSAGHLTLLIWPGRRSSFPLKDVDEAQNPVTAEVVDGVARVGLERAPRPLLLRVRTLSVAEVRVGGAAIPAVPPEAAWPPAEAGWRFDPATSQVWIRVPASAAAVAVEVRP